VHFVSEIWVSLKPANLIILVISANSARGKTGQSLAVRGFAPVGYNEGEA